MAAAHTAGLDLVTQAAPSTAGVVDVGGGAGLLVDELLAAGYRDITVLDSSQDLLVAAHDRIGDAPVAWLQADVRTWKPDRTFDVWHDAVVWSSLADAEDRHAYADVLRVAVAPNGHVVIASVDGATLAAALGEEFVFLKADTAIEGATDGWYLARRC